MPGFDLIVRGGLVATPDGMRAADVGVREGRFAAIEDGLDATGVPVVDATGCHVLPGAIDAHVHLGLVIAGEPSRDDVAHGTLSAICGGVTTVGDFTVQAPDEGLLASVQRRIAAAVDARCDWFLHANLTTVTPETLAEIGDVVAAGVGSLKTFLAYPGMRIDAGTLAQVVARAAEHGALVMVHAEDQSVVDRATSHLVARGDLAARYFFASRPDTAEAVAVEAVGAVSARLGLPIYVVHLSSAAGLAAAVRARASGARLHLETCPQYLYLACGPATPLHAERLVCAPPLRSPEDGEALGRALADGTIEVLATDHCPFTTAQKEAHAEDFRKVPGGLPGVETMLPLAYDAALAGGLSLERLAAATAGEPARLLGIDHSKGAIREGLDADFVVLDPAVMTPISLSRLHSRADYTPYQGRRLRGAVREVFLRGELAARRSAAGCVEPLGNPRGGFVHAKPPLCH